MRYEKVALGGTFSLLHPGHRHLLKYALSIAGEVVVGVTSDEFAASLGKSHPVEPYEVRALRVLRYCLRKARRGQRVTVTVLDDVGGPAGEDPSIEALIATEETFINALGVLKSRVEAGLKPLHIIVVEPLLDSRGNPFSSTRIWQSLNDDPR